MTALKGYFTQKWKFDVFLNTLIDSMRLQEMTQRARFTKEGTLARERNSKTGPLGMESSAGDLLTKRKLKKTCNISFP